LTWAFAVGRCCLVSARIAQRADLTRTWRT
jgi:hypothetical protein